MSITEAINEWLLKYEKISEFAEEINTEELPNETKTLALQRTGVEDLPLKYIGEKGWYKQYQFILLLKNYSESNQQRTENLDWLDEFTDWIEQKKEEKDFPKIENKIVKDVSCANSATYEVEEDGSISNYYIQLYFNIRGGY